MGDWTESKYTETRFGGMDKAVEPHTLDRDGGIMADEFNMMSRTQGLRTRKGWRLSDDLSLYVSSLPGKPKPPLALIGYETNLVTVAEDDDDDDDGGDGGNGGVIGGLTGGGDDDDVTPGGGGSGVSLTLTTPQAVVAEVPFAVSSGASAHYTGSNAHLEWSFAPDGQPSVSLAKGIRSGWSGNAWSTTATILTADRTRTGVTAVLKKGSGVQATKNMGYSVASMIPSLPSSVPYRQQFNFTIACKLGGAVQQYYEGNGRGVALRWQAYDESNNPVSFHVSYSMTGWANGVGTYSARLTSVSATAVKLKVTTIYAGENQTAEADISGVGMLRVPSSLHVFAGGGTMRINAVGLTPSSLSIVAYVDGEAVTLSDYLELAGGTPLDISSGWDGNVWEHDIQAKSGAAAATLTLKLRNGEAELASETITIADGLTATIAAPSSINVGEDIEATATIAATGFTLTRLPEGTVHLQIGNYAETDEPNAENDFEITATMADAVPGTHAVQVVDTRTSTAIAETSVVVLTMKGALAEAINERVLAKTGANGTSTDEDDASTLRTAAISAITGFAKGSVNADGTFTPFDSSNHEIPAAEDTDAWYETAYDIVCSAKSLSGSATMEVRSKTSSGSYSYDPDWDYYSEHGEFPTVGTESGAKSGALAKWEENQTTGNWTSASSFRATISGGAQKSYGAWSATCGNTFHDYRIKADSTSTFSRTADLYFKAEQYQSWTYDNLGHHNLANGETKKLHTQSKRGLEVFDWLTETVEWDTGFSYKGYVLTYKACIITFDGFKHK